MYLEIRVSFNRFRLLLESRLIMSRDDYFIKVLKQNLQVENIVVICNYFK